MDEWIAKAVGLMHVNKITNIDVASKMGVTKEYVSMLLNGKKTSKTAEQDIMGAIEAIITDRT